MTKPVEALRQIANGDGYYGAQAKEYKDIARAALPAAQEQEKLIGELVSHLRNAVAQLEGFVEGENNHPIWRDIQAADKLITRAKDLGHK